MQHVSLLPAWMAGYGAVCDVALAHALAPAAPPLVDENGGMALEPPAVPSAAVDGDEIFAEGGPGTACPVCYTNRGRPDVRAFACDAAHPEPLCGACTRAVLARGETACPHCRRPRQAWIP